MIENNNILFKSFFVVLAIALSVILLTPRAYAFTIFESYGPAIKQTYQYVPSKDYYYLDLYDKSDGIPSSEYVMYARYVFYTDEFNTVNTDKTWSATAEGYSHYIGSVINCNGYYEIYFMDGNQNQVGYVRMHTTEVKNPPCDSSIDFEDQFPEDERGRGGCDCIFRSPHWEEYMGKIDDIIAAIPPPPNWQHVANIMRDTIVPRMINDLDNLLGTAPPPPAPPSNINIDPIAPPPEVPVHDYANELQQSEPTMNDNTALEESVYDADDIINDAPEIEFNEDPTGGFNIMNPLEALPPTTDMPLPGQHAGEWDHQPQQQIIMPTPIPEGAGDVEIGDPPIPNQPNEPAPIPDDNYMPPPTPNNEQVDLGNYKPHPDAPDGSG